VQGAVVGGLRASCPESAVVSSEFKMVKLLRAYGECLGARSR
jgi:hypothetical protein